MCVCVCVCVCVCACVRARARACVTVCVGERGRGVLSSKYDLLFRPFHSLHLGLPEHDDELMLNVLRCHFDNYQNNLN